MSNDVDSSTERDVLWRKRLYLLPSIIKRNKDYARQQKRSEEEQAAWIISEFYRKLPTKEPDNE